LLDADADRADLELRLIKLLLKDRAREARNPIPAFLSFLPAVEPIGGVGGAW
jgi:hypothetical protein